jgi:hypothetical protein
VLPEAPAGHAVIARQQKHGAGFGRRRPFIIE